MVETKDRRFTLRIDKILFDKLRHNAQKNKRSIAKEIEYIVDLYFKTEEGRN